MERLVSRGRIEFVGPRVDNRFTVEVIEVGEDSRFEFILGCNANAAEYGSSHLGEEPFHQVEPGAVFRREHQGEPALWLGGKPRLGLLGDVRRVIVEDQLDGGVRRIGGVDFLRKPTNSRERCRFSTQA